MERTIVVGDIHGHLESVEAALAFNGNVVFVGDYVDSFTRPIEEQVRCLTTVLDAIEDDPGRVVGLLGNHEWSYLNPSYRCSGWNQEMQTHMTHLHNRVLRYLREYWWVGEVLVSHAGIDDLLLEQRDQTYQQYLDAGDYHQVGRIRGGMHNAIGGLYWNDFNHEMEPVPGLKQVVGHSYSKDRDARDGVRVKHGENGGETWCVDNLGRKMEVAIIANDEIYQYPLMKEGHVMCRNCRVPYEPKELTLGRCVQCDEVRATNPGEGS